MSLPERGFILDEPCEMCGVDSVVLQFRKAGSDGTSVGPTRYWTAGMWHTCNTCGYKWLTKTLKHTEEARH